MKKLKISILIALVLCFALLLSACGSLEVKENASVNSPASNNQVSKETTNDPIELTLLYMTKHEKDANIVRDMLTKEGFVVNMNPQADLTTMNQQHEAGNYDLFVYGGSNPTRLADYGFRASFYTGGSLNYQKLSDPQVDSLIDAGQQASITERVDAYAALENYMVDEQAYITPLYQEIQGKATNVAVDPATAHYLGIWWSLDYVDTSLRSTRTLNIGLTPSLALWTIDVARSTSNEIGTIGTNMYIQLINLDDLNGFGFTTDGTLSRNYAISEDTQSFYFILRDDCYFSRVDSEGNAYVTDRLVAGEDVVYSMLRAADIESVPGQAVYSYFTSLEDCALVTDLEELKTVKTADGKSIYDVLNDGLAAPVTSVTDSRDVVDNDAGCYQVVRIDTNVPSTNILSYLTSHYGGILDSEWVESINSKVDFKNYDPNTDVLYGDVNGLQLGDSFNNTGSYSGCYVLTHVDDYIQYFVKNEGFYTDEGGANIENINVVYCADADARINGLRSGEIDIDSRISTSKFDLIEESELCTLETIGGSGIHYIAYNVNSGVCSDINVRQAIAACINQDDIIAAMGDVLPCYSLCTCCFDTGNVFTYTPGLAQEYLAKYYESIN